MVNYPPLELDPAVIKVYQYTVPGIRVYYRDLDHYTRRVSTVFLLCSNTLYRVPGSATVIPVQYHIYFKFIYIVHER